MTTQKQPLRLTYTNLASLLFKLHYFRLVHTVSKMSCLFVRGSSTEDVHTEINGKDSQAWYWRQIV